MEADLIAAKFEMDELYSKITSSMPPPSSSGNATCDPRVTEAGKPNLGRRLAVRLLVGGDVESNPKTLAAAAAVNAAAKGKALAPDIDILANVKRVTRPPVGSSRLSSVTCAPAPADHSPGESSAGPSKPASAAEVAQGSRSNRSAQHAVVARKPRAARPSASSIFRASSVLCERQAAIAISLEPTSSIDSNSSTACEKPSQDDPMDEFFAIMEQFVEEPVEMEYLRAAEAARRNRKGPSDATGASGAKGGKPQVTRQKSQSKEFARQPSFQESPVAASPAQAPVTQSRHHQRQKSFAGVFPNTFNDQTTSATGHGTGSIHSGSFELNPALQSHHRSASISQNHHHARRPSRVGDMLESSPSVSIRETSVAATPSGNRRLSHPSVPRERSRSFCDRVTQVEPADEARLAGANGAAAGIAASASASIGRSAAVSFARSNSFSMAARAVSSTSRDPREQQEQRVQQRETEVFEASQQRELESLIDALKAEICAKDQLLGASEGERKLLEEELRSAWDHVADLERQLEGMQAAGAAMEREIDSLRAQAYKRSPRRGGSEGDMAVGNHILEMERALGELTRKLAATESALQRSEAQNSELSGKVAVREDELGRTKSALQQAELERDSLADEMEAALASWAADSPRISPSSADPSAAAGEIQKQEAAKLANALQAAQRELQVVQAERNSLLVAVGQPRRQGPRPSTSNQCNGGSRNRSLTPPPNHSRATSFSASSCSGPMELQRNFGMEASPPPAGQQKGRHVHFSPRTADGLRQLSHFADASPFTSPSRRLHFPLPSPPHPPPDAFTNPLLPLFPFPSRRSSLPPPVAPHFPLPSLLTSPSRRSSLPPPVAYTSPARRLHFPLPSPALPPPIALLIVPSPSVFAGALAPSVSVGQQHHRRLCRAAPRLPPPALRQPLLDCPLPPPVHPSLTTLHLSHCPLLTIGFPLPSSSSSPSASSPPLLTPPSSLLTSSRPHSQRPLPLARRHASSSSAPHQPPPHSTPPPRPHTPPCG
ncbi:unnamed protein product [Closterium sp. NIES-65]|nr:unnamed protein product [Closterium sp. NIES-65]